MFVDKLETKEKDVIVWRQDGDDDKEPWNWYHKGSFYCCYSNLEEALREVPDAKLDAVSWGEYLAAVGKLVSGRLV